MSWARAFKVRRLTAAVTTRLTTSSFGTSKADGCTLKISIINCGITKKSSRRVVVFFVFCISIKKYYLVEVNERPITVKPDTIIVSSWKVAHFAHFGDDP